MIDSRIKRGAFRRRARGISIMLVFLIFATVVIWTISAFLPPESHYLKLGTEENVERIPTAMRTETKDCYSSASPFLNKDNFMPLQQESKEDSADNKDTEKEEEKQVEDVPLSDKNQGKTPNIEGKKSRTRGVIESR